MAEFLVYFGLANATLLLLVVLRAVYRITLHPLAKFPGPVLAGATSLYQAWYDLRPSTSYIKRFPDLHKRYGPIVRITPDQLHVFDMAAYNEIFKVGTRYARYQPNYNTEAANGFFNILDPKAVKPWRDAYQPYFSKAAISRLEPLVHDRIKKFLSVLESAAATNKPVDLSMGYRNLTSDVVTSYMFADKGFELVEVDDFRSPILEALEEYFNNAQWSLYWPNFMAWLTRQMQMLTKEQTQRLIPALAATNWITEQCGIKVKKIMQNHGSGGEFPTVFDAWANPNAKRTFTPSVRQLTADAFTFHGAGTDTTAHALTVGTWHLINDQAARTKLKDELRSTIRSPKSDQLRAVIKESLRMSMGVPGRMARVVPQGGAVLCGQNIPEGTSISSVSYCYHFDETYFPDPEVFRPERWLGPDATQLENRMIAFSRGPRSCIGINLAYAELFLNFGYVFRKFDMLPYETTAKSMEWKDNFVVTTNEHLRVMVRLAEE